MDILEFIRWLFIWRFLCVDTLKFIRRFVIEFRDKLFCVWTRCESACNILLCNHQLVRKNKERKKNMLFKSINCLHHCSSSTNLTMLWLKSVGFLQRYLTRPVLISSRLPNRPLFLILGDNPEVTNRVFISSRLDLKNWNSSSRNKLETFCSAFAHTSVSLRAVDDAPDK